MCSGTILWANEAWVMSWDMHIMAIKAISRGSDTEPDDEDSSLSFSVLSGS